MAWLSYEKVVARERKALAIRNQETVKAFRSRHDRDISDVAQTLETLEVSPMGRGILLWLLGIPIPIIILILLFFR